MLQYISTVAITIILATAVFCIVTQLREEYSTNTYIEALRRSLLPVHRSFQTIPIREGTTSFTVAKKRIYLCLKDNRGDYYDTNTLRYVLLHEMAHVLTPKEPRIDGDPHTDRYERNFNVLLRRAVSLGLYDPKSRVPGDYCGT
jgi:hypothetical protein